jgi:eukaryotic-like serine/threonine-protein kinase
MPVLNVSSRAGVWQLLERLGRGGEAETWRARRSGLLEDEVCVRIPFAALQREEQKSIIEEATLLSRVRHAHVVTLLDLLEDDDGRLVMVLELVRGMDLKELGRRLAAAKTLPNEAVVAAVGRSVCLALGAMQRAIPGGAVHRDVSPHNVLCSKDGDVKLADFGIAKRIARERRTRTGEWKGKAAYVAPEVILGRASDVKSDLFSLGVVLYELSSGTRPFLARGCVDMLDAIAKDDRVPLGSRTTRLSSGLVDIVERLLSRTPDGRPTPEEAARAFADTSDDESGRRELSDLVRLVSGPSLVKARNRASSVERNAVTAR